MKGKAKIDFEQWYKPPYIENNCECGCNTDLSLDADEFYKLPQTMQQGVLLQFFRERETIIEVYFDLELGRYSYLINKRNENGWGDITVTALFSDYFTAFTHAIDKACEIYGGEG